MSYIKGKFKNIIYQNYESNYVITLFRVKESDIKDIVNKTITVTGTVFNLQLGATYIINGNYQKHPKYSWQMVIEEIKVHRPTSIEEIEEFLSSPFIEGCGKVFAQKIVEKFKEDSLKVIKENYKNLLVIEKMTPLKALKIYNSVLKYDLNDDIINKLKEFGFSLEDASKIISKRSMELSAIMEGNFYLLKDLFDFKKLDELYKHNFDPLSPLRCKECILNTMMQISFNEGSTYYFGQDILRALNVLFNINLSMDEFNNFIDELTKEEQVIKEFDSYFLKKYYDEEFFIASKLYKMSNVAPKKIPSIDAKIKEIETINNVTYNDEQKNAIKKGLNSSVSIISGGPGTGKTTIIKALTKIYIDYYKLDTYGAINNIALLAPTGRAAKRMSQSTGLPAYTIHRFLKWHKDDNSFEFNEDNKIIQKLVIVDESSMLDVSLMKSLLCALYDHTKLILVGDIYQLPSVGPGLVLQNLINSDYFEYNPLNTIYRQSENSYIPFLAKDIKQKNIDEEFMYKRDDYNFIVSSESELLGKIESAVKIALSKNITEDNLQILAPMYKGENGIDNINKHMQLIYNPHADHKKEIAYGDKIYRENDKVLQLVNDSEKGVFNGDIGKIIAIYKGKDNKLTIDIDYDNNIVSYEKKDLKNITHAYAISVHKSQGSEFEHVIMPVCSKYYIMMYNKLLYTAVSRAKTSLTIIGDPRSFTQGISNNYASERKTMLNERLKQFFNE